jgi:hypothetical protein
MRGSGEFLDKESPIQGPWCRSEEKREPVGDINIAMVDSLKVLDPRRPIREATIRRFGSLIREVFSTRHGPSASTRTNRSNSAC